ncbi:MAG TPA: FHA domain-containing protein [Coleofasciculaceae cyanobacterium]|jgi:ferredoxin-NADP reductase/ferredoxin
MLKLKSVNFEQQEFGTHILTQSHPGQLEWVIGRYATCDLVLSAQEVSRVHGKILYQDDTYYFIDDGSTSGSSLNGEILEANDKRSLRVGDLLQIGETYIHVEEMEPPSLAAASAGSSLPAVEQPWSTGDLQVRCCRIVDETPDVKTFCFVAEPPMLFNYKPGQFVNIEVEIDGKPILRPYSISSSPTRPYSINLTVKREASDPARPGLVSSWLHSSFKVGDRVKLIGTPLGHFTCLPDLPPKILLISAGSGITPMMSMARWVQDTLADTDIVFLHSARRPEDIIFREELSLMSAQMPNFRLAITTTQPSARHSWMGLTGRISKSMLHVVVPDLLDRAVYACGPDGFVTTFKSLLESVNFPMQQYKQESFGGKPAAKTAAIKEPATATISGGSQAPTANRAAAAKTAPAPAMAAPSRNGQSKSSPELLTNPAGGNAAIKVAPLVKFANSDRSVPADGNTSVLELAEQEGIPIRNACRVGSCGACKVLAREGQVQYEGQPIALSDADRAAGYILCCIARPVDRLVVEA